MRITYRTESKVYPRNFAWAASEVGASGDCLAFLTPVVVSVEYVFQQHIVFPDIGISGYQTGVSFFVAVSSLTSRYRVLLQMSVNFLICRMALPAASIYTVNMSRPCWICA